MVPEVSVVPAVSEVSSVPVVPSVVINRSSEIVVREGAPSATRLAAEELNFFLKLTVCLVFAH